MSDLNLHKALAAIDINADWVGLREVREATTYRVIRDGNPQVNSRNTEHGDSGMLFRGACAPEALRTAILIDFE